MLKILMAATTTITYFFNLPYTIKWAQNDQTVLLFAVSLCPQIPDLKSYIFYSLPKVL